MLIKGFAYLRFKANGEVQYKYRGKWLTSKQIISKRDARRESYTISKAPSLPRPSDTGIRIESIDNFKVKRKIFTPVGFIKGEIYFFHSGRWRTSEGIIKRGAQKKVYYDSNREGIIQKKVDYNRRTGSTKKSNYFKKIGIWRKTPYAKEVSRRRYVMSYALNFKKIRQKASNYRRRKDPTLFILDSIKKLQENTISFDEFLESVHHCVHSVRENNEKSV